VSYSGLAVVLLIDTLVSTSAIPSDVAPGLVLGQPGSGLLAVITGAPV
jgi:phosphate:Na+ symporter